MRDILPIRSLFITRCMTEEIEAWFYGQDDSHYFITWNIKMASVNMMPETLLVSDAEVRI